jgi:hypothetical protein
MSRVHDRGGQTGFGPVPVADDGTVAFHADWEARVYALAAVLRQRGLFNSDELRDAIERLPRYVRGQAGDVVARLGDWVLPDASVAGLATTEPCYAVRFAAADLFGSGDHTVTVDLWESYLERA